MCVCVGGHGHALAGLWWSPPAVWVLGIKLKSSALAAVTLPAEPPHQPGKEL